MPIAPTYRTSLDQPLCSSAIGLWPNRLAWSFSLSLSKGCLQREYEPLFGRALRGGAGVRPGVIGLLM